MPTWATQESPSSGMPVLQASPIPSILPPLNLEVQSRRPGSINVPIPISPDSTPTTPVLNTVPRMTANLDAVSLILSTHLPSKPSPPHTPATIQEIVQSATPPATPPTQTIAPPSHHRSLQNSVHSNTPARPTVTTANTPITTQLDESIIHSQRSMVAPTLTPPSVIEPLTTSQIDLPIQPNPAFLPSNDDPSSTTPWRPSSAIATAGTPDRLSAKEIITQLSLGRSEVPEDDQADTPLGAGNTTIDPSNNVAPTGVEQAVRVVARVVQSLPAKASASVALSGNGNAPLNPSAPNPSTTAAVHTLPTNQSWTSNQPPAHAVLSQNTLNLPKSCLVFLSQQMNPYETSLIYNSHNALSPVGQEILARHMKTCISAWNAKIRDCKDGEKRANLQWEVQKLQAVAGRLNVPAASPAGPVEQGQLAGTARSAASQVSSVAVANPVRPAATTTMPTQSNNSSSRPSHPQPAGASSSSATTAPVTVAPANAQSVPSVLAAQQQWSVEIDAVGAHMQNAWNGMINSRTNYERAINAELQRQSTMIQEQSRTIQQQTALIARQSSTLANQTSVMKTSWTAEEGYQKSIETYKTQLSRMTATSNDHAAKLREAANKEKAKLIDDHSIEVTRMKAEIERLQNSDQVNSLKWGEHWRNHYRNLANDPDSEIGKLQEQLRARTAKMGEIQKEKEEAIAQVREEKERSLKDLQVKAERNHQDGEKQMKSLQAERDGLVSDFQAVVEYNIRLRKAVGLPLLENNDAMSQQSSVICGSLGAIAGKLESALAEKEEECMNHGWKLHEEEMKKVFQEQFDLAKKGREEAEKKLRRVESGNTASEAMKVKLMAEVEKVKVLEEEITSLKSVMEVEAGKARKEKDEVKIQLESLQNSIAGSTTAKDDLQTRLNAAEDARRIVDKARKTAEDRVTQLQDLLEEAETSRNVSPGAGQEELERLRSQVSDLEEHDKSSAQALTAKVAECTELEERLSKSDEGRVAERLVQKELNKRIEDLESQIKAHKKGDRVATTGTPGPSQSIKRTRDGLSALSSRSDTNANLPQPTPTRPSASSRARPDAPLFSAKPSPSAQSQASSQGGPSTHTSSPEIRHTGSRKRKHTLFITDDEDEEDEKPKIEPDQDGVKVAAKDGPADTTNGSTQAESSSNKRQKADTPATPLASASGAGGSRNSNAPVSAPVARVAKIRAATATRTSHSPSPAIPIDTFIPPTNTHGSARSSPSAPVIELAPIDEGWVRRNTDLTILQKNGSQICKLCFVEQKKVTPNIGEIADQPPLPKGIAPKDVRKHLLESHPTTLGKLRAKRIRDGKDK